MTDRHPQAATRHAYRALCMALLLSVACTRALFAAEPPVLAQSTDMSMEVGNGLNSIIDLMNAQKLDEAAAAMTLLRAASDGMSDYEKLRILQLAAELNFRQQKYPEAIADYEAVLQTSNLSAADRLSASRLIGELHIQQGDWSKGVEQMLVVKDLELGQNKDTLLRIAYAYSQLGQAAAAIPYMEQVLVLGGDQAGADDYKSMAVLYMQAENHAKAITTYEKLLEVVPDIADRESVSANLAALYIQVGDKAKATSALRALIRQYPNSAQLPTYRQSLAAVEGTLQ